MFRIACISLFAILTTLLAPSALSYPEKSIRVLIPFAPGGGTDLLTRALQHRLEQVLGVNLVVDNRPGGGGTVGVTLAARSAPDGYTLLITSASFSFIPGLHKDLPYDAIKDFKPLTMLTQQPLILLVHPSLPVKNVKELIALARKSPKALFYAATGVGGNVTMTTELFKYMAKVNLTPIQYKGGGPATIALLSGEVPVYFGGVLSSKPFRKSGQVRALAVTTKERNHALPDLPTIHESGVPGFDKGGWTGMFAPAQVPDAIIAHIYQAMAKVLKDPEAVGRLADDGYVFVASTPDEFTKFVHTEIAEWTKLSREMKLAPGSR